MELGGLKEYFFDVLKVKTIFFLPLLSENFYLEMKFLKKSKFCSIGSFSKNFIISKKND